MQIGIIGLGKMGYNLALNFNNHHQVTAFDINKVARENIAAQGVNTAHSISHLVNGLTGRRIIWIMVPAGNTIDVIISTLKNYLKEDDIVIDGGNSHFKDTIARAKELEKTGVHFLDCGTGGGKEGALNGISAMVGGKKEIADYCEPLFRSICVPDGYLYCGKIGNGHFTKMAYSDHDLGMKPAISEGMRALHRYTGEADLVEFAHVGKGHQGALIRSWLN